MSITEREPTVGTCPVGPLARAFNPFTEPFLADPYEFWRQARREEPVFYSPELGYWVLTRHDDIVNVFRDTTAFSATITLDPYVPLTEGALEEAIAAGVTPEPTLVNEDPPEHTRHRRILNEPFTPKRVKDLEGRIRQLTVAHIDHFMADGRADLVAQLVWEVPALVIFTLLGIPDEEVPTVKSYTGDRMLLTWGRPSPELQKDLMRQFGEYWNYCKRHVDRLAQAPGDDFMSALLVLRDGDDSMLSMNYLYGVMLNYLYAGHETTTNGAANGLRALLSHRDQWELLCQHPALIPNAVDECLRFDSSVPAWRRYVKTAVTIRGVEIPAGAKLLLATASANHDEDVFDRPEALDVQRPKARDHLSFGFGAHVCSGAPLARLEMRIFLEELTRRLPHLELEANQTWTYSPNTSFRGPSHLWCTWDPGRNPAG